MVHVPADEVILPLKTVIRRPLKIEAVVCMVL
jgi:hypothetical protein